MRLRHRIVFLLAVASATAGCSTHVPVEKVFGTYVASYPYGTETITFRPDYSFIQTVIIQHGKPVTAQGHWEFDPKESRIAYTRAMIVDDGFGGRRPDWQKLSDGLISFDVETHWVHIEIGSGLPYPYMKQ